jgi:hypothetical protein
MGTQADPGTDGDGTFPQPPPYDLPPESLGPINNAPKGMVTGPFLHTQTGTYTGWDMWKFTYYVYVPSQYKAGHAAALMIFNDGYLYAGINSLTDSRFNAPQVFDNLIAEGSMPVTIAVFIFPGTNDGHQVGGATADAARSTTRPTTSTASSCAKNFCRRRSRTSTTSSATPTAGPWAGTAPAASLQSSPAGTTPIAGTRC